MSTAMHCLAVLIWVSATPVVAAHVNQETFGCKSLASAERLTRLKTNDPDRYRHDLGRMARAGECRIWQEGEQIVSKDDSEAFACFASKGMDICYWSAKPQPASRP